jgi:hypothetical protein
VFELDEHEGRPSDLGDLVGAEHDVLEGPPTPDQQGEAALTEATQRP